MKKTTLLVGVTLLAAALEAGALPDYKVLCDKIGDIPGWTMSQCEGMKMTNPMMGDVVTATKSYTKGDATIETTVVSGMQAMMMWGPYSTGTEVENDEALVKIEKVDNFTVGISYDKQERSGGIVVQLAPNAVLAVNFENLDWKDALEMVKKLDWKDLAEQFTQ
ncbi:hypothetical protein [Hydrogenimonas sp.]|uniref:hypothetical protein n=1 Tax=Hydrogenimonas sp. TaxID=2231112 RepID=UPI00262F5082|nr:hypothetical protein [Hydrogenimonas sp.]